MIWPETIVHDLHYGLRMLRRNAGTTAITVLALAGGIGVNTAVFTGYKAMVARPLDARAAHEMVNIAVKRDAGAPRYGFSYPDYESLRDSLHSLNGLVAFRMAQLTFTEVGGSKNPRTPVSGSALGRMGLLRSDVGGAQVATVCMVSENYFNVLGIKMLQGRSFESFGKDELSLNPPVMISENYWQRRFNRDPAIIGKIVYLNGATFTISGITPHDFVGSAIGAPAFWMATSAEPAVHADAQWLRDRENQQYRLYGRLAASVSMSQAQAEMNPMVEHLRSLHAPNSEWSKPGTALIWPGSPFPLPLKEFAGLNLSILLTMAAAGMVLVVACANVASLQLARARSRENELRTRMSLGASRTRVIRQLVTESAMVGVMAGALALLFTWALLKGAVMMMANAVPGEYGGLVFDVTPDVQIFVFVSLVSLIAGMLSGFVPAIESSRSRLITSIGGGTAPARSRRLQDALVGVQVAFSLVLMVAGSMAIRSSIHSVAIDTGYESRLVLALNVHFPETLKYDEARRRPLIDELRRRLTGLPGVEQVTHARPPVDSGFRTAAATISQQSAQTIVHYTFAQTNYFETLGIPIVLGRGFSEQGSRSVIISESMAKELWPGQGPIGRSIRLGLTDERSHNLSELLADGAAYQVVGVARDTRAVEFHPSDSKRVYLAMPTDRVHLYPILVRTRSEPAQMISGLDALLTSIDPNLMANCATLEEMQHQSAPFIVASLAALIASSIGLLGLLLALMGIYGTVSYIVVLRTREVGIRMAIGAQKRDVLGLILNESARPIVAGLIGGCLLATGGSYLARGLLYGLNGVDGISLGGVSLMFLFIGLAACYPPAHRATRVDPLVALRYE